MMKKIFPLKGSSDFELLSSEEKLFKWWEDKDYGKQILIGRTFIFYSRCRGCGMIFEGSATFYSHEDIINFELHFCNHCIKARIHEQTEEMIFKKRLTYSLICKQCNNNYNPLPGNFESGFTGICESYENQNLISNFSIISSVDWFK